MYRAKSAGKGRWVHYEPTMRTEAVERLRLEADIAGALDSDQLELHYQPVFDLQTDRVVGFEALLRWHHPALGLLSPDRFIPLAEENGQIVPIGRWVLLEACRTAVRWQEVHPAEPPLSMAVNVSARQLAADELVRHVAEALTNSGLPPGSLVLELTETSLIRDASAVTARLHELRALGVRLAVDDFGTGYSSLAYLENLPVDILKIDKSFVDRIADQPVGAPSGDDTGANRSVMVSAISQLGHALSLQIVAEGIEAAEQVSTLRGLDCQYGQGYYFARPLPAGALADLLSEQADGHGWGPLAEVAPRRASLLTR
jgi:EAL domain-containing protein (putative c-di-GMP-specific phosphodiesterase class I)